LVGYPAVLSSGLADPVGVIYDEAESLNFCVDFGAIAERFGDLERTTNRHRRQTVLRY